MVVGLGHPSSLHAQEALADDTAGSSMDTLEARRIGRAHEVLGRSAERHALRPELADLYGAYNRDSKRAQRETGLQHR